MVAPMKLPKNRFVSTNVMVVSCYAALIGLRAWPGIDRIPNDPGYESIFFKYQHGLQFIATTPYVQADQTLLASLSSLFPLELHAIAANLLAHVVWIACALWIFQAARLSGMSSLASFGCGLVLILSPWASQSSLGNYGNVRWPLLAASIVIVATEVFRERPSISHALFASTIGALSNPLAIVLLIPVGLSIVGGPQSGRRQRLLIGIPPLGVFVVNSVLTGASGHSVVIRSFWSGAGLFWLSGQLLPSLAALLGVAGVIFLRRHLVSGTGFLVSVFVCVMATAILSYYLGGIADRYFTVPAVLAGVGWIALLKQTNFPRELPRRLVVLVLTIVVLVPAGRWFSVLPWLSSGQRWSRQIADARQTCDRDPTATFEFITSSGDPTSLQLSCNDIK